MREEHPSRLEARDHERAEALIEHLDEALNVALVGPSAVGKTALALATVRALYDRAQEEEMSDPGWRTCQWSHLSQYTEANWLNAPIVWELIQLHEGYGYEDLVRGGQAPQLHSRAMGNREEGLGNSPRDRLLIELALLAQRREARAHRRERPSVGPTVLIIDGADRGDLGAALGETLTLLESTQRASMFDGSEGVKVRLRSQGASGVIELSMLTLSRSFYVVAIVNDEQTLATDEALWRRFRVLEVLPDRGTLSSFYGASTPAGSAALSVFDATSALVEDPMLGLGHGHLLVDPGEGWARRMARRVVHEVLPALRRLATRGALIEGAEALRLERGVDTVVLPLNERRLQRAQVDVVAGWFERL